MFLTRLSLLLLLSVNVLVVGCTSASSRTTRVAPYPQPRFTAPPPPPPAPQVMITEVTSPGPRQVAVATITEEQRTELLRAVGSPIRPHTPPVQQEPTRTVYVERQYVNGDYGYDCYPPSCASSWDPLYSVARVATFTGLGAIIGHQFHEKGQGAAIGAGFAILTSPWWWGGGCGWN